MTAVLRRRFLLLAFWPFTALILFLDSRGQGGVSATGQLVADVITPLFLLGVMSCCAPRQKLTLALWVPISAFGEGLFSLVFKLYAYRLGTVPFYVPFGHSILLGTAWLMVEEPWFESRKIIFRDGLVLFHVALIAGALLLFGDTLSVLWGAIFCWAWWRKKYHPVFLVVGVLVLYVEILGTGWQCWAWRPEIYGALRTANPPVGAFAMYILGEVAAIRMAGRLAPVLKRKWRNSPVPV